MISTWTAVLIVVAHLVRQSDSHCFQGNSEQKCSYTCHCVNDEPCDYLNGTCPSGCDTSPANHAWTGPGCQRGLVSVGKPTEATFYGEHAHNCVDNVWGTAPYCYVVNNPEKNQYWLVDLKHDYVIEWVELNIYKYNALWVTLIDSNDNEVESRRNYKTLWFEKGRIARKVKVTSRYTSGTYESSIREAYVYGYRFEKCERQADNTFYWGPGCLNLCTGCAEQCDLFTGLDCTKCRSGYQGDNCEEHCRPGYWGELCHSDCNCDDDTEVCDRVTGACPVSGCPTWYINTGCDYLLPQMSDDTEPILQANGTRVQIAFKQWNREMGGSSERVNYRLMYEEVRAERSDWLTGRIKHDDTSNIRYVNVTMPTENVFYYICVVPYDVDKDLPGRRSPCNVVFTI